MRVLWLKFVEFKNKNEPEAENLKGAIFCVMKI